MKYILMLLFTAFLFSGNVFSQTMRSSIGLGSAPNKVIIYMKPDASFSGTLSTVDFALALPAATPAGVTCSVTNILLAGFTWQVSPSYVEDIYRVYDFTTPASPFITMTANVEYPVMEVTFSGGVSAAYVRSITLPDGGTTTGNAVFFCSGAIYSNGSDLYYARPEPPGTTVFNGFSYKPGGIGGTDVSYSSFSPISLPVNWLSFSATKQGNNALLNWNVANEGKCDHYDVLRSTNGTDFTKFGTVSKSAAANGSYSFTDLGVNSFSTSVVYYRVKQVDIDAASTYSEIKHIDIDKAGVGEVTIFPNPVKDGFYVNVPLTKETEKQKVTLNLYGTNGQIIASKVITAQQAANFYFDITDRKLASGQYNLQVVIQDKMIASKMLTINQ